MYYRYWGKSSEQGYHLLAYHGLDAAAVTGYWVDYNIAFLDQLSNQMAISRPTLRGLLLFFGALHDAGKFSVTFQNLRKDLYYNLQGETSEKAYSSEKARHDDMGWMLWNKKLIEHFVNRVAELCPVPKTESTEIKVLLSVFARVAFGHHGKPPSKPSLLFDDLFLAENVDAARAYSNAVAELFLSLESMEEIARYAQRSDGEFDATTKHLKAASWKLAGMMVLCDWLASGGFFPFVEEKLPLDEYYGHACESAEDLFSRVGLYSARPSEEAGLRHLFKEYADSPTPLQRFCNTVDLVEGPQMWVLEDVTGAGKTEAACTLVSRVISRGLAEGAFVALPTMTTSNAMYTRMSEVYHRFFSADGQEPSLVLSHGTRRLYDKFVDSYRPLTIPEHKFGDQYEDNAPRCSEWLADSTKKSLLADVGVGTLDQVLLGTLRVRFLSLRALGLSTKVLVVDEVHAYDPYMLKVLEHVLTNQARLGMPVILLSATLPRGILKKLCQAYLTGIDASADLEELPAEYGFPIVTRADAAGLKQFPVNTRPQSDRILPVQLVEAPGEIYRQIRAAHERGQAVCWIRNTIHDVRIAYNVLKDMFPEDDLIVFHSRFTMKDRQTIEDRVLLTFGRDSGPKERRGKVLIASQVVEQSLDLDFDFLVSDLAPIELLIQRAGRQHRHLRDEQGNRFNGADQGERQPPVFYVLIPPEPDKPTADWFADVFPKAQHVYENTAQLWRTKEILRSRGQINLPDDARLLVESVYGKESPATPVVFDDREQGSKGQERAEQDLADFNTIRFDQGYSELGGSWDTEERIRTRLGDEQRVVYLARFEEGRLQPYVQNQNGWDLSAIRVRAISIKGEINYPSEWQTAIDSMRAERWIENDALFLIVEGERLEWRIVGDTESDCYDVSYDVVLGLCWT